MNIRIAGYTNDSITDGPGLRFTIFTQGCPHRCPGCHNPRTHDPAGGELIDIDELAGLAAQNVLLDGITISGGDPFFQPKALEALVYKLENYPIIIYTGHLWENLAGNEEYHPILERTAYLVDGKYIQELRSLSLPFRGSSNQRIIDVQKSLRLGEAVVVEDWG